MPFGPRKFYWQPAQRTEGEAREDGTDTVALQALSEPGILC